ncbi:flagellar biosynthesis anti-sigma factor FlgM [Sulfurihydrogenibium azorense]|uniref:flagellar biosynthesis anti-sigma factor FlgM n=1 Tax=Sulfurihydrogenibium azorense TaxID=309806 RepID=UPI00240A44D2|nr:flagellar biosynthesis anti-sigma factor FlgM [Sulfurihydrogenibium azorense]MDM7274479.1 flagellar biosynthesis anti-sigma factor FlgM [Sulfurihydrogenibium azorense]
MRNEEDLNEAIERLKDFLNQEEKIRQERIEEIKRLIAEGKYDVPVEELVEKILKKLKERP